jgi:hypothetical protein
MFFGVNTLSSEDYYKFLEQIIYQAFMLFKLVQLPQVKAYADLVDESFAVDGFNALRKKTNLFALVFMVLYVYTPPSILFF